MGSLAGNVTLITGGASGMGEPSDAATMALNRASSEGSHVTGTTVTIDTRETI